MFIVQISFLKLFARFLIGGVVVISHDSQLLSSICDNDLSEVWIVEDGQVKVYKKEFEDYKEELIEEINNELDDDE